jgi:hypothetical protein
MFAEDAQSWIVNATTAKLMTRIPAALQRPLDLFEDRLPRLYAEPSSHRRTPQESTYRSAQTVGLNNLARA